MGNTKAGTYPHHMGHLETNLSVVYVQNSRIQARSGGKPFHLGWQLELCWKKLWNVSSLAPRNLHSIPAAAHREGWARSSSLPARSSCSCSSGCHPAARKAQKLLPFKGTESQGLGHLKGTCGEPFPAQLVTRTAGSGSGFLHRHAGICSACTGTAESIK